MNSDLWWLANNEPVWNEKHDRICIFSAGGTEFFNSKYFPGKEGFTKEEHKSARRRLGLDHPEIFPASTPEEDEAWAEAEKKLNPVWQSPHPIGGVCVFHGCRYAAYEPCPMCVLAESAKEEAKQPAYDPDDVAFVRAGAGHKHDTGKPAMHLIPANIELEVARVMQFGAEKYGAENWRSVPDLRNRYMSAAMRHINAMRQGFVIDDESGLHHSAHAICCLMFLAEVEMEE